MIILFVGITLGHFTHWTQLPWFGVEKPTSLAAKKDASETAEGGKETSKAIEEAPSKAELAATDEAKDQVPKEDSKEADLRRRCKNSFYLCGHLSTKPDFRFTVALIQRVVTPLYDEHSEDAKEVRSADANRSWYLNAARGKWKDALHKVVKVLSNAEALADIGFDVACAPPRSCKLGTEVPAQVQE